MTIVVSAMRHKLWHRCLSYFTCISIAVWIDSNHTLLLCIEHRGDHVYMVSHLLRNKKKLLFLFCGSFIILLFVCLNPVFCFLRLETVVSVLLPDVNIVIRHFPVRMSVLPTVLKVAMIFSLSITFNSVYNYWKYLGQR